MPNGADAGPFEVDDVGRVDQQLIPRCKRRGRIAEAEVASRTFVTLSPEPPAVAELGGG